MKKLQGIPLEEASVRIPTANRSRTVEVERSKLLFVYTALIEEAVFTTAEVALLEDIADPVTEGYIHNP